MSGKHDLLEDRWPGLLSSAIRPGDDVLDSRSIQKWAGNPPSRDQGDKRRFCAGHFPHGLKAFSDLTVEMGASRKAPSPSGACAQ